MRAKRTILRCGSKGKIEVRIGNLRWVNWNGKTARKRGSTNYPVSSPGIIDERLATRIAQVAEIATITPHDSLGTDEISNAKCNLLGSFVFHSSKMSKH